jgi:hypothetical protein
LNVVSSWQRHLAAVCSNLIPIFADGMFIEGVSVKNLSETGVDSGEPTYQAGFRIGSS